MKHILPGCCAQSSDPGLEYSHEERVGIFSNYDEVNQRQEYSTMDDETHDDCDHVQPQLTCHHLQVSNGDDLPTDETGNTNRRVPTRL